MAVSSKACLQLASALAGLGLLAAGAARAQGPTPDSCWWVAVPRTASTHQLWCRGPDGRARPVDRLLEQGRETAGQCAAGKVYDGVACVSERDAIAALEAEPVVSVSKAVKPTASAAAKPRTEMTVIDDGQGNRAGFVCKDGKPSRSGRTSRYCRMVPVR